MSTLMCDGARVCFSTGALLASLSDLLPQLVLKGNLFEVFLPLLLAPFLFERRALRDPGVALRTQCVILTLPATRA